MSNSKLHKLKITSGIHKGTIIPLAPCKVTLGSHHSCDIILSDKNIADKHLEIEVEQNTIFIHLLGHPITLDGKKLKTLQGKLPLHSYQQIYLGDSSFSISDSTGKWTTVKKTISKKPSSIPPKETSTPPAQKKPSFMSISKVSLLLITGLLLFTFIALLSEGPEQINASSNDNNTQSLARAMNAKNKSTKLDAQDKTHLILQSFGMTDITLEINDDGILNVSGAVKDSSQWELAQTAILQDIPFVEMINDSRLITSEYIRLKLKKTLKTYGLDEKLVINTSHTACTITGELRNSEYIQWEEIKESYLSTANVSSKIIDEVINISKKLSLSIQSVSIGKTRYFVSSSGVKYMVGSDLGNGYTVLRIEPDEVVLAYKSTEVSVNYIDTEKTAEKINNSFISKN